MIQPGGRPPGGDRDILVLLSGQVSCCLTKHQANDRSKSDTVVHDQNKDTTIKMCSLGTWTTKPHASETLKNEYQYLEYI